MVYFPYLSIGDRENLTVGDIEIWNLSKIEQYVPDINLQGRIKLILQAERRNGKPINDIGIVAIGNRDFRVFNDKEFREIQTTKLLLFIAFLAKNNTNYTDENIGHRMATSDNFRYMIRNFHLESDHTSTVAGYVVREIVIGYKLGEVEFDTPASLPKPLFFSIDEKLIEELSILKCKNRTLFNRIMNAIEVFYEAYYNSSDVSQSARILLQTSAFMILLNAANGYDFRKKIDEFCSYPKERRYRYRYKRYRRQKKQNKLEEEQGTMKRIWANRFYTLRNHIIHGDEVCDTHFLFLKQQRHFDIALLFFVYCIKELINQAKLSDTKSSERKVFFQSINWGRGSIDGVHKRVFTYEDDIFSQTYAEAMLNIESQEHQQKR